MRKPLGFVIVPLICILGVFQGYTREGAMCAPTKSRKIKKYFARLRGGEEGGEAREEVKIPKDLDPRVNRASIARLEKYISQGIEMTKNKGLDMESNRLTEKEEEGDAMGQEPIDSDPNTVLKKTVSGGVKRGPSDRTLNDTHPIIHDNAEYVVETMDTSVGYEKKISSRQERIRPQHDEQAEKDDDEEQPSGWETVSGTKAFQNKGKTTENSIDRRTAIDQIFKEHKDIDRKQDMKTPIREYPEDEEDDKPTMDDRSHFASRPAKDIKPWVDEETAFVIEGCTIPGVNGLYMPDGFAFGEWPRWKHEKIGLYVWYSSKGVWYITDVDELDAHHVGPEKCKVCIKAEGGEWCPPQSGWLNKGRKENAIRLFIRKPKAGKKVIGGIEYDAEEFLPMMMRGK